MAETKQKEQADNNKNQQKQQPPVVKEPASVQKQLAEKDALIQEYTNQLKRLQAEFENYMKRQEKERHEFVQFATEKLISKLLVIIDSFEHAVEHLKKIAAQHDIVSGIEMVAKEFTKILEGEGLKQIHAKGNKFDPYSHEVVTCVHKNDCQEDTVVEEVQKGYKLGNKTIRYAKVIISKQKQNKEQKQQTPENRGDKQ